LFEFNATANGGGGQPFTYSWDFGDGQSGGGSAVSHSYPNAGNYSPLVRATDSLGASRTVSLSPIEVSSTGGAPVEPLSVTMSVSTSLPRVNESISLSGTGRGGSGGYACSWNFGDNTSATGCSASHAWNATGSYRVLLSVSDSAGHHGSSSQTVDVITGLTATFGVGPSPAIIGEPAELVAHPTGGVGPYNCTWEFGDGANASGCAVSHGWTTRGRFVIRLVL